MKVDCDHTIDDQEPLALLDGTLEEVLFADAFHYGDPENIFWEIPLHS